MKISGTPSSRHEAVLRIHVRAERPGWQLGLVSRDLKSAGGDSISSRNLRPVIGKGAGRGLTDNKPVPFVVDGKAGDTHVSLPLDIALPEDVSSGIYETEMVLVAARSASDPHPVLKRFAFKITLQHVVEHQIVNTRNYLHFGNTTTYQRIEVKGKLQSDLPVSLVLERPQGSVSYLDRNHSFSTVAQPESLFVEWRLDVGNTGAFRPPDNVAIDGTWMLWNLPSPASSLIYTLAGDVIPVSAQAPGDYSAAFDLSVEPMNKGRNGRHAGLSQQGKGGGAGS